MRLCRQKSSLDAQSFIVIRQRAKFEPANGQDGKPAKDSATQQIIWRVM